MAPIQVPAANISTGCARQFYHPTPYTTWPCQLSWSSHHCRLESTSRHWTIAEIWTNISRNEPSHRCRKDYSPPLQSPFLVSTHLDHLVPSPAFQQCTTHSKANSGTKRPSSMPVGNPRPTNPGVGGDENGILGCLEQPVGQLLGTTLDTQSVKRCFADFKSTGNKLPAPRNSFDSLTGSFAIMCPQRYACDKWMMGDRGLTERYSHLVEWTSMSMADSDWKSYILPFHPISSPISIHRLFNLSI